MMAVMFLIISAVIATPFALGMVSVYSGFMESFGQVTDLVAIAPLAGQFYLIIHSFLVGMIISLEQILMSLDLLNMEKLMENFY